MNRDEVIALAKKLYDGGKGISYQKIADKLNSDGVATLSGKGSWDKRTIQRLVSADTLKKAEVKVGMKTDREVQLESEVESLKFEQSQMLDVISMLRNQHSIMSETLQSSKDVDTDVVAALESENAELESELNKVKQDNADLARKNQYLTDRLADSAGHVNGNLKLIASLEAELNTVKQDNDRSKRFFDVSTDEVSKYKKMCSAYDAENQRLHRMLNEAELKYKTLYESEINRLGSELAIANQKIQELRDKQTFLKPKSESEMPVNFMGWTTCRSGDYVRMFRKFSGKMKALYIGKEWNESDARNKIAAFELKNKLQSELFAGTECKSCQHQPEFESRLRSVCPETVRTYRLDTVAGHFPDCDFSREMIALAEQKRIELLAGDPSQCDTSKLIQYRGRMYVNFEWR